jgi:hypothetical protein
MDKTGQLAEGASRCDECGRIATVVIGRRALCSEHSGQDKEASIRDSSTRLKSFVEPDVLCPT